jgi:beta-apo-4'-carotenal oxygenase
MAVDIPAFEATPVPEIAGKVAKLRATFNSQKTKDVQFRLVQLRKLYWG